MDASAIVEREVAQNITVRKWSTLASLAILLYEYSITLNNEVRYIWRRPPSIVRTIYLLARYIGIIVQSVNVYLVFWAFSRTEPTQRTCKRWFLFQTTVGCMLVAGLDSILMLRVYALYRKSRTIGAFLVFILWGQVALDITIVPRVVNVRYDAICDTRETSIAVLYFSASIWFTHVSLAIMTAAKYDLMKLRAPIVRVVTRDGAWIMFIVCGVFAGITPVAVRNQVSKAHMILGWPITILSVASCRMIMNMQTLDLSSTTTTDVEHDSVTLTELDTLQIELQDM